MKIIWVLERFDSPMGYVGVFAVVGKDAPVYGHVPNWSSYVKRFDSEEDALKFGHRHDFIEQNYIPMEHQE